MTCGLEGARHRRQVEHLRVPCVFAGRVCNGDYDKIYSWEVVTQGSHGSLAPSSFASRNAVL